MYLDGAIGSTGSAKTKLFKTPLRRVRTAARTSRSPLLRDLLNRKLFAACKRTIGL
jgi:hypothetical protein